jgi:hypothetical protein
MADSQDVFIQIDDEQISSIEATTADLEKIVITQSKKQKGPTVANDDKPILLTNGKTVTQGELRKKLNEDPNNQNFIEGKNMNNIITEDCNNCQIKSHNMNVSIANKSHNITVSHCERVTITNSRDCIIENCIGLVLNNCHDKQFSGIKDTIYNNNLANSFARKLTATEVNKLLG